MIKPLMLKTNREKTPPKVPFLQEVRRKSFTKNYAMRTQYYESTPVGPGLNYFVVGSKIKHLTTFNRKESGPA